jgi:hypothetical protein
MGVCHRPVSSPLATHYGRIARLRPVTGYLGAADPTATRLSPENEGLFRVQIETGERTLIASLKQMRDLPRHSHPNVDEAGFYINHSLCSRDGKWVYFSARGRTGGEAMAINVPFSVRTDGRDLMAHRHIGGPSRIVYDIHDTR